jgi:hypothetical protein|tara:strand:- start:86 stop:361 length:276 start_codon:yes stop_codon:yes gene_type:complete
MLDKRYYILKRRLKSTQDWTENFLEVERHRSISKRARRALNKDRPFLGLIFIILYLPTRISEFISDTIWWNRYHKAQKEVEIMKEEVERYE